MQSSLVQVPGKSGAPQGVLGWVQLFAAAALLACVGAWARAGWASAKMAAAASSAAMDIMYFIRLSFLELLLLKITVNQFFHEFNAFEFVELRVLLFAAVQDRADLPWP